MVLTHVEVFFGIGAAGDLLAVVDLAVRAGVLVDLARLLVLVEDRLGRRVVNPHCLRCPSDGAIFQNEFQQLLAPLVAHVIVGALAALALLNGFGRLLGNFSLLGGCGFLIHNERLFKCYIHVDQLSAISLSRPVTRRVNPSPV